MGKSALARHVVNYVGERWSDWQCVYVDCRYGGKIVKKVHDKIWEMGIVETSKVVVLLDNADW